MKIEEIVERQMCMDPRVYRAIQQAKITDKSFTEKGFLGITPKYTQPEVRKIWFDAMSLGMNEGLRMGSLEGQRIDLFNSCKTTKQKEFLEKFYKLAEEYNCAIKYSPIEGMCIVDLTN